MVGWARIRGISAWQLSGGDNQKRLPHAASQPLSLNTGNTPTAIGPSLGRTIGRQSLQMRAQSNDTGRTVDGEAVAAIQVSPRSRSPVFVIGRGCPTFRQKGENIAPIRLDRLRSRPRAISASRARVGQGAGRPGRTGLGTIRDTLADLLFPGTSTIQRRAR